MDAVGAVHRRGAVPGVAGHEDMLRTHVETRPDAEAIVEPGGHRLTYTQLRERAARVAGGPRALSVERGDRVAVRYPTGTGWALAFWGTALAGGTAMAVNTRSTAPELDFVLGDAGVKEGLAPGTPRNGGGKLLENRLRKAVEWGAPLRQTRRDSPPRLVRRTTPGTR